MKVTTNLNIAHRWLMADSAATISIYRTRIGITLFRVVQGLKIGDYLKWQDKNREMIECLYDGYLMAGVPDCTFEEFSRKLYSQKCESK